MKSVYGPGRSPEGDEARLSGIKTPDSSQLWVGSEWSAAGRSLKLRQPGHPCAGLLKVTLVNASSGVPVPITPGVPKPRATLTLLPQPRLREDL